MVMVVSTSGMVGRGRVFDPLSIAGSTTASIYGYAGAACSRDEDKEEREKRITERREYYQKFRDRLRARGMTTKNRKRKEVERG